MLKVITLQADPETGVFDDSELKALSEQYHVISWKQDFYFYQNVPQMVVFVEYRAKKPPKTQYFGKQSKEEKKKAELSERDQKLLVALKKWRNDIAKQTSVPPMTILHNAHLEAIVRLKPSSKQGLRKISGIGQVKSERYAADILALVHQTPVQEAIRVKEEGVSQKEATDRMRVQDTDATDRSTDRENPEINPQKTVSDPPKDEK